MAVQDYRELKVWQKAMDLVTVVYQYTKAFPKDEMYGLTSQLRWAAVSVPSNIAEGQGRRSTKEFLNQLSVVRGSLLEVQTQVEISKRLCYFDERVAGLIEENIGTVIRLLNGLMNALNRKID